MLSDNRYHIIWSQYAIDSKNSAFVRAGFSYMFTYTKSTNLDDNQKQRSIVMQVLKKTDRSVNAAEAQGKRNTPFVNLIWSTKWMTDISNILR